MIIIPVIFEGWRSLKSKDYKLTFESNELTPEQSAGLNESLGEFGYLAFKKDAFKQSEKDMMGKLESDFEDKRKTPGQRLRGVLFVLFEQNNEGFTDFTKFYESKMEKIIGHFKNKLDD